MEMQTGDNIGQYMRDCRYAVNGARVKYLGVEYFAGIVQQNGNVELHIDVKHDQPDVIAHMDLIEFI